MNMSSPSTTLPGQQAQQVLGSLNADYDKVMRSYWDSLLKGARPSLRTQLEAEMHRVQRDASLVMISATFAYDPLRALAAYPGPGLIIDTSHGDGPTALHRQVPQIKRRVISDTSHWPQQLDDPQAFNRLLATFSLDREFDEITA